MKAAAACAGIKTIRLPPMVLALLAFVLSCCAPRVAELKEIFTSHTKGQSSYLLYSPPKRSGNAPLVMALHGYAGDAASMARLWSRQEGLRGAFVVAPQAPKKQRRGRLVSTWSGEKDEALLLELLDDLLSTRPIDPARVAVVGYSSGASMAARLAIKHPERFPHAVLVGGGLSMADHQWARKGKFFLLAGDLDRGFNRKKMKQLAARLEKGGASVEYALVPHVDHAALYAAIKPAADWLAKTLEK